MNEEYLLLDRFDLTLYVPRDLGDDAVDAIRLVLIAKSFRRRLRRAITRACRRYPALLVARVRLSQ